MGRQGNIIDDNRTHLLEFTHSLFWNYEMFSFFFFRSRQKIGYQTTNQLTIVIGKCDSTSIASASVRYHSIDGRHLFVQSIMVGISTL